MWDDIIIGTGSKGNSAIIVHDFGCGHGGISHNRVSYWINESYLDTGLTIMKDTKEGKELAALLEAKKSTEEVQEWLLALIFKHLRPAALKARIDAKLEESFKMGREHQAHELQRVLTYSRYRQD